MVGFCHGGNVLGNHDDNDHDDHNDDDDDDDDDDHPQASSIHAWHTVSTFQGRRGVLISNVKVFQKWKVIEWWW